MKKNMCKPVKTILLTASNLGPYHRARYSYLSNSEIDLLVVKSPVKEFNRPWQRGDLNDEFRVVSPYETCRSLLDIWSATRQLMRKEQPDVVICVGYNRCYVWILSLFCFLQRVPCLLYLVGWLGERHRSNWKEWPKRLYCRIAFRGAIVTGTRSYDYARFLGIRTAKIFTVGNVVDNSHFQAYLSQIDKSIDSVLPDHYFVATARLTKDKNIDGLLQAFIEYRDKGGTWSLCIAGIGPDEARLKASVPHHIADSIQWLGWVGYEALPELYGRADCFILPSFIEPWGLVVNEAMAAGLPILVSTQCGCQPELVQEGHNGFSFKPDDIKRLAALMQQIQRMTDDERDKMGNVSRKIVEKFTISTWAQAFANGIQSGHECKTITKHQIVAQSRIAHSITSRTFYNNSYRQED